MKKLIALAAGIGLGIAALTSSGASAFTQHTTTVTFTIPAGTGTAICTPALVSYPNIGPYAGLPIQSRTLLSPTTCQLTTYVYY